MSQLSKRDLTTKFGKNLDHNVSKIVPAIASIAFILSMVMRLLQFFHSYERHVTLDKVVEGGGIIRGNMIPANSEGGGDNKR